VDSGAEQALRVHKKSLLLSGVCEVQGNFSAKDPVNIFNLQHELIGVGLAAQSAQALRVLLQQSEANGHTRAVIHRDDLFLADGHL
jgi:glutamate 5-kinase